MSVTADIDTPRAEGGEGFSDALTVSFGDLAAGIGGTARLGISGGARASGLVVVFDGADVGAIAAESSMEVEDASSWDAIAAAGLDVETVEPLRAWRLSFAGEGSSFDLELEAVACPFALDPHEPVARLGRMNGFEQPLRVRGTVQVGGRRATLDGLGQRGRSWGAPDWTRIERTRALGAWFGETALSVSAISPAGSAGHDTEAVSAVVFETTGEGPVSARVEDPRLSTTFGASGCQRRAALELWMTDDGPVRRAAGQVICGTTLDLGRLRLDCAFLRWRMEGREGIGRYDILSRTPGKAAE